MLRTRIITALILAPLLLLLVFWQLQTPLVVLLAVAALIAADEWGRCSGLQSPVWRVVNVIVTAAGMALVYWSGALDTGALGTGALAAASALWVAALLLVVSFPRGAEVWDRPAGLLAAGWILLVAAWWAMVLLRDRADGAWWLVFLLVVVWGADIGAYAVGRWLGKTKLAPAVSPGKSWEGVAGGALLAACAAVVVVQISPLRPWLSDLNAVWLGVTLALVSVVGDLSESMLKRRRGFKDSGSILPGHGGVLDRIDGLLAAAPVFGLWVWWVNA